MDTQNSPEHTDMSLNPSLSDALKLNDDSPKDSVSFDTFSTSSSQQQKLFEEKLREQKQRYRFRWIISIFFALLLLGQHILLACFITSMISADKIQTIQPLLSIIIPATLGETYAIIKIIVKYVFAPGDFKTIEK